MTRLASIGVVTGLCFLLFFLFYHERLAIATSVSTFPNRRQKGKRGNNILTTWEISITQLVATFIKFPYSSMTVMSISEKEDYRVAEEIFQENKSQIVVPNIIHQVKLGGLTMRPTWVEARSSCQQLHPTWEFKLWEDSEANEFVGRTYPQLYETYRNYPLGEFPHRKVKKIA